MFKAVNQHFLDTKMLKTVKKICKQYPLIKNLNVK